jgi:putative DNA primase/helicase
VAERARKAALALSGADAAGADSQGVELLGDTRKVFDAGQTVEMPTKALITALSTDEERPWATYSKGEPITDRQLAKLLKPFGIVSTTVHPPGAPHAKGYRRADFEDAWDRYL